MNPKNPEDLLQQVTPLGLRDIVKMYRDVASSVLGYAARILVQRGVTERRQCRYWEVQCMR